MDWHVLAPSLGVLCLLGPVARALPQGCPTTELASGNIPVNHHGARPGISSDGRYVAFISTVPLVPGASGQDIYVADRYTGSFERVSEPTGGGQANGPCFSPAISPDGNCVIFRSDATNLVAGDTNGKRDVFVHDRTTGITERVNVDSSGAEADGDSENLASLSFDGRYAVFSSYATNLIATDANGHEDVFLRDRVSGTTELVSIATNGDQGNNISYWPVISHDGRYVAFNYAGNGWDPNDGNGGPDVYRRDRQTGTTLWASCDSTGTAGDGSGYPSISANGHLVAFTGGANLVPGDNNGLIDIFVKDMQNLGIVRVSVDSSSNEADDLSMDACISADGNSVAFFSAATNLVAGDTNGWADIFVHDLTTTVTERVSVATDGSEANAYSGEGIQGLNGIAISGDGSEIAFWSTATNLVPGFVPVGNDIFLRARGGRAPTTFCSAKAGLACGLPAIGAAGSPSASATSGFVISAGPARQNKSGLLIYGNTGTNNAVFQGGTLCVKPPVRRTTTVNSGGASLCGGTFAIDMNAFASGNLGGNPQAYLLLAGSKITAQFWGRDTLATGSFLSDGLIYIICP